MEDLIRKNELLKAENQALKLEIESLKAQLALKSSHSKRGTSPSRERRDPHSPRSAQESPNAEKRPSFSLPLPPTPGTGSSSGTPTSGTPPGTPPITPFIPVIPTGAQLAEALSASPGQPRVGSARRPMLMIGRNSQSLGGPRRAPSLGDLNVTNKETDGKAPLMFAFIFPDDLVKNIPYNPEQNILRTIRSLCEQYSLNMESFTICSSQGQPLSITDTLTMADVPQRVIYLSPASPNTSQDLNKTTYEDLMAAATEPNIAHLKQFLSNHKTALMINKPDLEGQSILYRSSLAGFGEAVLEILNSCPHIDLDYMNEQKKTALHAACASGHGEVVALLLANGASTDIKNKNSRTAQQEAIGVANDVFGFFEEEGFDSLASKYPRVGQLKNRRTESPDMKKKKSWKINSDPHTKLSRSSTPGRARRMGEEENINILYSMHGTGAAGKKAAKIAFVNINDSGPFSNVAAKFSDVSLKCVLNLYKIVNYHDMLGKIAQPEVKDEKWAQAREAASEKMKKEWDDCLKNVMAGLEEALQKVNEVSLEKDSAIEKVSLRINALASAGIKGVRGPIDNELVKAGRLIHLMRSQIIIGIQQKATILFFTTSQILTDFVDISLTDTSDILHFLATVQSFLQTLQKICDLVATLHEVEDAMNNISPPQKEKRPRPQFEKQSTDDVWAVGAVPDLVYRLITKPHETEYFEAFMTTCPRFITAPVFIQKITSRWQYSLGTLSPLAEPIFAGLHAFCQKNYFLLDTSDIITIQEFIVASVNTHPIAKPLREELLRKDHFCLPSFAARITPNTIPVFSGVTSPSKSLFSFQMKSVAEQLTLIEYEVYKNITPIELLDQAWSKPEKQSLAQNVIYMLERANRTSLWVATSILLQKQLKERSKVVRKFISLAKHLLALRNFNALMGVIVGLNMSSISRLKSTFASLPARCVEDLNKYVELTSPSSSFKTLREAMESGTNQENCLIPYVGITCSDLTFIEENPSLVQTEQGLCINVPKHKMVYTSIHNLLKYQKLHNNIQHQEPLFTFLSELPMLDNSELYQLSLEIEPRATSPQAD